MYYKNPKDATKEYGILQKQNLTNYVKIQESQYQEYTRLYGVNVDYFARNINYYDSEGNINKALPSDFTFFTGPETRDFIWKIPLTVVIDYGQDAFMFSNFGIETTSEGSFYITKRQFYYDCLQYGGKTSNIENFKIEFRRKLTKAGNIGKFKQTCWVDAGDNSFEVNLDVPKIDVNKRHEFIVEQFDDYITSITRPTVPSNTDMGKVWSTEYDIGTAIGVQKEQVYYNQFNEFIKLTKDNILCLVRIEGNEAIFTFELDVVFNYYDLNNNAHWNTFDTIDDETGLPTGKQLMYEPQVGDFIRLYMLDNPKVFRDYKITNVSDTNFSGDKFSPFLSTFLWECTFTLRNESNEVIPQGNETRPPNTESIEQQAEQLNLQTETREKYVYDYQNTKEVITDINETKGTVEKIILVPKDTNKDEVFGGFGEAIGDLENIDLDKIYGYEIDNNKE